jgi:Pyruvate/2-oxoacid:ferredoxin oxidoreductase delta subunit
MAHTVGKDLYRKLGKKIDGLPMRAPWNETFSAILKELYTPEEADLLVKMPYGLSSLEKVARITGYEGAKLRRVLDDLCSKGLVLDIWTRDQYRYMPSPMVVGIFEMTMMRTGGNLPYETWAKLFHDYMSGDDSFYAANSGQDKRISPIRALPHEEVIKGSEYVEVLDYEKATSIVEDADQAAIGICSCRHEKLHVREKSCQVPLEKCSSFGISADYLVRHNLARQVSKSEMLENIARSKEEGLVFAADNSRNRITFICHCCRCCCNVLLGIRVHGYPNTLVTSNYLSEIDQKECTGCGVCAQDCPIDAIEMVPVEDPTKKRAKTPQVDASICLGCGVCGLRCPKEAVKLVPREQRVLHPESSFERVILQCLERGTLQNQLFDDPGSMTHEVMRGIVGGFLRLSPVKKALMSDALRSRFLASLRMGVKMQGREWLTEI